MTSTEGILKKQQSDLEHSGYPGKMSKRTKYEKLLQLIEKKPVITLEICRKRHPEIPSSTFYARMGTLSKHDLVKKRWLTKSGKRRMAYQKTDGYTIEKGREIFRAHLRETTEKHQEKAVKPKPLQTNEEITASKSIVEAEQEMMHEEAKRRVRNLIEDYMRVLASGNRRSLNEERLRIAFIIPLLEALGWEFSGEVERAGLDNVTNFVVGASGESKILVEVESPNKSLDEYRITREGPKSYATLAIQHAWNAKADWVILTNFEETRLYSSKVRKPEDGLIWKIRFTNYESRFDELAIVSREKVLSDVLRAYEAKIKKPLEHDQITDLLKKEGPLARKQILEKLGLSQSYQFPWFVRKFGSRRRKVYYLKGQEEIAREKYGDLSKPRKPTPKHPTLGHPKEYFLDLLSLKRTRTSFSPASDGTPVWWERKARNQYTCSVCKRYIDKGEKYIGRKKLSPGMRGMYGYRGTYHTDYYHIICLLRDTQAQIKRLIENMQSEIRGLENEIAGFRQEIPMKRGQVIDCQTLTQKAKENYERASFWRKIDKWFSYHYTSWSKSKEISHLEKEISHIHDGEIPERKTQITSLRGRINRRKSWLSEIETRMHELTPRQHAEIV